MSIVCVTRKYLFYFTTLYANLHAPATRSLSKSGPLNSLEEKMERNIQFILHFDSHEMVKRRKEGKKNSPNR